MGKKTIRCSECQYCEAHRPYGNARCNFMCEHPDKKYIGEYYKEHNIKKMEGFIGFGKKWSEEVPIKSSPAWCPKKKG